MSCSDFRKIYLVKNETGYSFDCPFCEDVDSFYPNSNIEQRAVTADGALHTCYKCENIFKIYVGSAEFVKLNQPGF